MNTKTKLLYVGFRALSTCCLYAAFLMITSCGDNVVNPDSPEPDGEDMIPVTVSRVEDGSYMESHVDTPDFRKVGSNYVFQSAADFTTNGASAPTLRQGNLLTRAGTVRVIGYSFNSTAAMGTIPSSYTYNSTSVTIPNMNSDFMVYDSGVTRGT